MSRHFKAGDLTVGPHKPSIIGADVVKVYRATDPDNPTVYERGDSAEAEPAAPGWTMPVDDLFPAA